MAQEKKDIEKMAVDDNEIRSLQSPIAIAKAMFLGEEGGDESNALRDTTLNTNRFTNAGAIAPIYDPVILALIYENSSNLRQNVDAYVTNVDSFGHHLIPVIDVDEVEADEAIRDALRAEKLHALNSDPLDVVVEPTDKEVTARKEKLRIEIRAERARMDAFFANCSPLVPFNGPEGLRGLTRQDIEVFGYGYWEILRNGRKQIARFNRLEARSIRLMPLDTEGTKTTIPQKISILSNEDIQVTKRFRRYQQRYEGSDACVFFKEFGDPRCVSAKTGKVYADEGEMQRTDTEGLDAKEATEVIEFKISSVRSQYGVPRWVGAMLAVLGTRQAEEVNFLYFENRSVPPMALLVSGGRLQKDTVGKLEDYIANQVRGKRNFHKIMIIEAESVSDMTNTGANNGKIKIELKPLTDAQQKDALFQGYDERNADKVGQMFRLPRLLRGDVRDFNRSTAEASLDFAEVQVFGPLREQFDWVMNALILPACGFVYHKFCSNAPTIKNPELLAENITKLSTASILTPEEGRALARGVFNEPLRKIKAPWTQQPIAFSLANRKVEDDLNTPDVDESDEFADGSLDDFNAAGGMSMPGAGPTQAALQVDQTKADATTGDLAQGGALAPAQGNRRLKRPLTAKARALLKIQKYFVQEAREEWKKEKESAERLVIPRALFDECFKE